VAEAGEYAWDLPHMLSTRRIGPDLSRVGLKVSDDWHYAHHWDPRLVVPESLMPAFPWLFAQVTARVRRQGDTLHLEPSPALARHFTLRPDRPLRLVPDRSGLTFVPPAADGGWPLDGTPVLDLGPLKGRPAALGEVRLVLPTREMVGLVRYLQRLGTSRGAWREAFPPAEPAPAGAPPADRAGLLAHGRRVFQRRCAGCHGSEGDGVGPAATFLDPRPRDLTAGIFKFRTTPSGSLPVDADLFRTISRGLGGTAMPGWHELPRADRMAVVAFVKTLSPRWTAEKAEPPEAIAPPPSPTEALLARGAEAYRSAKCGECHGDEGRGDGPSAAQLRDDFDQPVRPTDFTRGRLKGGATVADVYRTLTLGLDGTPMPSFADALPEEERWALAYHVLRLSAWSDPLTGQPLDLSRQARAALDAGGGEARPPARAWPAARGPGDAAASGRRYYRGIRD
jgi:cytochrome c oxidase cbb3-type subunit 2